jgi:hypothetical protein
MKGIIISIVFILIFSGLVYYVMTEPLEDNRTPPSSLYQKKVDTSYKPIYHYHIYEGVTSQGNDIAYHPHLSGKTDELMELCDKDERCKGFSDLGYVKHKIRQFDDLAEGDGSWKLYVKLNKKKL